MKGHAAAHYLKVLINAELPFTQTTAAEQTAIKKHCKDAMTAVEIGVFEGATTALIAMSTPPGSVLYGIDPFPKGNLGFCYGKLITGVELKRKKVAHKVKLVEKLSYDALNDVKEEIDFIFIDGDHSWEGIESDWKNWSLKVKKGGIIALHDTSVPTFDPSRSRLESIAFFNQVVVPDKNYELLENVDSLNILRKIV